MIFSQSHISITHVYAVEMSTHFDVILLSLSESVEAFSLATATHRRQYAQFYLERCCLSFQQLRDRSICSLESPTKGFWLSVTCRLIYNICRPENHGIVQCNNKKHGICHLQFYDITRAMRQNCHPVDVVTMTCSHSDLLGHLLIKINYMFSLSVLVYLLILLALWHFVFQCLKTVGFAFQQSIYKQDLIIL